MSDCKNCAINAPEKSTYVLGNARFQWLTSRMLRLEWQPNGIFENRQTLNVINRNFPEVQFTGKLSGNKLTMKSTFITVEYSDDGKPFHSGNLKISFDFNGKTSCWKPGQKDSGNLGATVRTLDGIDGSMHKTRIKNPIYKKGAAGDEGKEWIWLSKELDLGNGLLSRDGWSLIDDSKTVLIDNPGKDEWVAPRSAGNDLDWYFLGYGHDYAAALSDGARLFGRQPLPPRYAFGYWWSRYWAYTDREIEDLVDSFDSLDVPIDVMVVDMDWHLAGWTGYTWDPGYFPDPSEFLANIRKKGMKVTLNLHPADGVGKHEAQFEEMAKAMGVNPKTADKVEFDITDKKYMDNYFKILHHPDERRGVDFWWMDWQQGQSSKMPGLDTLPWINHLHWHDMANNPERGEKRPLIFSRFGGIGAGRYCVGFSGDTHSNWDSLKFQPYFTATAANALYGYWSHDIGGHMPGEIEPELYTRWMQYGLYSPILRTHTTKNGNAERRVWEYPDPYNAVMMDVIRKRYEMVPYVYTECRKTYETGVSLCRPMYYEYPDQDDAYKAKDQYMFGSELLVAPVLGKRDEESELADVKIWLPEGEWIDTARGCLEKGGRWITRQYLLQEVPVFVRPGAIIPGQKNVRRLDDASIRDLLLTIYPGQEGSYRLYEDDGVNVGYEKEECVYIPIEHITKNGVRTITVKPCEGKYKGFQAKKNISIRLPGSLPPSEVDCEGKKLKWSFRETSGTWSYDGDTCSICINLENVDVSKGLTIKVKEGKGALLDGMQGIIARLERIRIHNTLATSCHPLHHDERIGVELAQIGNRISRKPETVANEIKQLESRIKDVEPMFKMLYKARPTDNCGTAIKLARHIMKVMKA